MEITAPRRAAPRISPPPSRKRHLWQAAVFAIVCTGLALIGSRFFKREDATNLRTLAEFSSAYAVQCDVPEMLAPPPLAVRDAYVHSRALQDVVTRQRAALASGASCEEVTQALRAADFPAPLPAHSPTITLHPAR
jgi:hypothetical protein